MKYILICSIVFLMFASVNAQDFSIKIDAEKDAFYDALVNPDDGKIFMPSRCYLTDVGTAETLTGDADCSAIVWTAWDDTYLYYYAEVTDDFVIVNNASSGGSQWSNDKIELKFDSDPTIIGTTNVIQCGITALGEDAAEAPTAVDNISNQDNDMHDADGNLWASTEEDYARKELLDSNNDWIGYILEWRVPVQYLCKGDRIFPTPAEGVVFGTAINVADNDDTQRNNMLQWSAGHADVAWSNAQMHGKVTLLANHKLKYEAVNAQTPEVKNDSALAWYYGGTSTSVSEKNLSNLPGKYNLAQNYPNPFNPATVIRYSLEKSENVSISIYNMTGQVVRELLSDRLRNTGTHEISWDARDSKGAEVPSGIYFYQIKTNSFSATKKMILLR